MSTKPTKLPRWASVTPPSPDPGAGKQDVGWVTGERPPAQYSNWLAYWNYKLAEYLNDGNLQGAHTFDSTVGVTGVLTANANINANAGITVGNNQNVTVSGTGDYKHGNKTLNVPLPGNNLVIDSAVVGTVFLPCPTTVGDRLKSVSWRLRAPLGGPVTVNLQVFAYDNDFGATAITAFNLMSQTVNTGAAQIFTATASPGYTVGDYNSLSVLVWVTSVSAQIGVSGIKVVYDRP